MKILIKSILVWGLFSLFLIFPLQVSKSCGPQDLGFKGYSFLDFNIVGFRSSLTPFYLDVDDIFSYYKGSTTEQIAGNLLEWKERFCNVPQLNDLHYVIYKASISAMEDLLSAISSENIPLRYLDARMANNSFVQYLYRNKCAETIEYLIFAKRCEPYVIEEDPWDDPEKPIENMQYLIDRGLRAFRKTQSHYFKLRYAYQIIRLAHYMKDHEQTIKLYDFLTPKLDNDPSVIDYWILGHYAGALQKKGDRVEAAYLFSKIFANCPSKRESAFRSFKIRSDEEWERLLLRCETEKERAVTYVLRAYDPKSQLVEEMLNIYELDPLNPSLEILAVREIQELEKDLLGYDFNINRWNNAKYHNRPRKAAGDIAIALQAFTRRILDEDKVARPDFWKTIEGYLEVLAGNYYFAAETFEEAQKIVKNDTLKAQLAIFERVLRVSAYDEVNDDIENEVDAFLRNPDLLAAYPDFKDFLQDRMASLFDDEGYEGKAFLCHNNIKDVYVNPESEIVDDLLAICKEEKPTRFERSLIINNEGGTYEEDLHDLKASYYMSQNLIEAALEEFKEIAPANWDNYGLFYPYIEDVNDCVRCPMPDSIEFRNKGELLQELLNMEYSAKAESDPNIAASLYLRLGLAFYNITYFSYNWKAVDKFRSSASIQRIKYSSDGVTLPHVNYPNGNREFFDCSKALAFFDKARITATDPELAARATFGAAKCEQNAYFLNRHKGEGQSFENFQRLVNYYSETNFYDYLIEECKYFRTYVNQ